MSQTRGRITIDRQGDVVVLAGAIDETARLHDLLGLAHGGRLVLDLAGITFINSLGVRDWISPPRSAPGSPSSSTACPSRSCTSSA
jgi:hypothetical protein